MKVNAITFKTAAITQTDLFTISHPPSAAAFISDVSALKS
jgi:hypothetical protein